MTTVGVLRETAAGERSVALTPDGASRLSKKNLRVLVEAGAGEQAWFDDAAYAAAGATPATREQVYADSDVLVCVGTPKDLGCLRERQTLLALRIEPGVAQLLGDAKVTRRDRLRHTEYRHRLGRRLGAVRIQRGGHQDDGRPSRLHQATGVTASVSFSATRVSYR